MEPLQSALIRHFGTRDIICIHHLLQFPEDFPLASYDANRAPSFVKLLMTAKTLGMIEPRKVDLLSFKAIRDDFKTKQQEHYNELDKTAEKAAATTIREVLSNPVFSEINNAIREALNHPNPNFAVFKKEVIRQNNPGIVALFFYPEQHSKPMFKLLLSSTESANMFQEIVDSAEFKSLQELIAHSAVETRRSNPLVISNSSFMVLTTKSGLP